MGTILQNAIDNAKRKGYVDQKSKESIDWYRKNLRKTITSETRLMREEVKNLVPSWTNLRLGRLYFAHYDPKHKDTLPVYDTFPIIIPIHKYDDGILGLNLHYLPPFLRAKILDELFLTLSDSKIDERKKLAITYGKLQAFANHKLVSPCIKRYLGNHFRSKFLNVPFEQWTAAVFLPVERFEKQTKKQVWSAVK